MDSSQPPSNIPIWVLLIIVAVLITLSMIFSATESAFLSINKLRVRFLKNKKDKKASRVFRLLNNKERLINTLLVGNDIVNIAISAILTVISLRLFGNAGVGIATFVATLLLLIFGEISPKTFATHNPEAIAFFFSGFISVLEIILSPLVAAFTFCSRGILKLAKINTSEKKVSFTEEEIKTIIDVSSEQGILEKNGKQMMQRAFKFSDLAAKDIMTPRKNIKAIRIDENFNNIIEMSERFGLSRFPVYVNDIDDIVGILYTKDLIPYKKNPEKFKLEDVIRQPLFILETKKMSSIQQMLWENKQSMAVVIDEYSGTYGVLTSEDIVREIFGSTTDENKSFARKVEINPQQKDNIEISGLSRLNDLNEQLGIKLNSNNVETLGGYICEKLGAIPQLGQNILEQGYRFTVSKMDDNRVAKVLIRLQSDASGKNQNDE